MQTFLPYPSFNASAACLDRQRLGKQRVEVLQILGAIRYGGGWSHHPVCQLWRGYEHYLIDYGLAICREWTVRGYRDTCAHKIADFDVYYHQQWDITVPHWLGNPAFHAAHRSNLLRKDPVYYCKFGWTEPPNLPYLWVVN